MNSCCARCMTFGDWKKYKGGGVYKGRSLCGICLLVVKKRPKAKTKKKSDNTGRDRERYLEKVGK